MPLELSDPFSSFISLCAANGACSNTGEAIPTMEYANEGHGMPANGTVEEGLTLFLSGDFPEVWAQWVLQTVGNSMSEGCREYFINKITSETVAFRLYIEQSFWTNAEDALLEAIFEGKLPVAEKELADGIVTRAKVG